MPATFGVNKTDILRSKVVDPPGWYPAVLKAVNQKPAKTDGSINTICTFHILEGPYAGVPIDSLFSEKAPGFAVPLMEALLGRKINPEGEQVDFEKGIGTKIKIYVINDIYQGRKVNKIEDYRPLNS